MNMTRSFYNATLGETEAEFLFPPFLPVFDTSNCSVKERSGGVQMVEYKDSELTSFNKHIESIPTSRAIPSEELRDH